MPGKKGVHWNKPKVNAKKMSIYLSEETGNKIELISNLSKQTKQEKGKELTEKEKDRDTPSGIAADIIEKNIDSYFNKKIKELNEEFDTTDKVVEKKNRKKANS